MVETAGTGMIIFLVKSYGKTDSDSISPQALMEQSVFLQKAVFSLFSIYSMIL